MRILDDPRSGKSDRLLSMSLRLAREAVKRGHRPNLGRAAARAGAGSRVDGTLNCLVKAFTSVDCGFGELYGQSFGLLFRVTLSIGPFESFIIEILPGLSK